ncbi:MAG TPA: hypothetical protein VHZ31_02225 [Solirubrobacteraceae bacterium]|jgi:hypothetical protein|nr:hypothetical protein [Solirubrobacteraceae bacterium]
MTYVSAGSTTHYTVSYDDTLSKADGADRAKGLLAKCEADYALMQSWFAGVTMTVATPMAVHIDPGPYGGAGWGPPVRLTPGNGSSVDVTRYLLVSEVVEMFMMSQAKGWFATDNSNEGAAGEGLSRFLGAQFLIADGLGQNEPSFDTAGDWLNSPRADFVNNIDQHDHAPDANTGCATLFIYYLHTQLGFDIKSIVAAAGPTLASVYANLTGDKANPFPDFKATLDAAFPPTNPDGSARHAVVPGPNPDDPFPLISRRASKAQGLCAHNGSLYLSWKGEVGDDRLFFSHFDGHSWAAQAPYGGNSSVGPSLAEFGGTVYAAWKGTHRDQRLFFSHLAGGGWVAQQMIPGAGSHYGPALATFGGKLYAAWRGTDDDQSIWFSHFDGTSWSPQARIPGVATSIAPSLCVFDGRLYAGWKGMSADQGIYYSSYDGTNWAAQKSLPGVATSIGPAIAAYNGRLFAAWKGMDSDQRLFYSSFDGSSWAPQALVPGNTGPDLY